MAKRRSHIITRSVPKTLHCQGTAGWAEGERKGGHSVMVSNWSYFEWEVEDQLAREMLVEPRKWATNSPVSKFIT